MSSTPQLPSSTTPYFGRAWSITITPNQGPSAGTAIVISSDAFEPEALRVTFEVQQYAFASMWQAELVIYNANGPITSGPSKGVNLYQAVIQEGDVITIAAGYQADYPYPQTPPIIFSGPIFYTIQDRVDVVDQRLIIHCLINRALTTQNFLNATLPATSTQFTQAQFIASNAVTKIPLNTQQIQNSINSATPQRAAQQLPRGKSYFGTPHTYLNALAEQNGLLSWIDGHTFNMASLQFPVGNVVSSYGPLNLLGGPSANDHGLKLSLIGQPQQTQLGVNMRVLLDPTVQVFAPLIQVGLDLQYVRQAPIPYAPTGNMNSLILPLKSQYVVVGVTIRGDTRGNPWYTDIIGCTNILSAVALLGQQASTNAADATGN